MSCKYKVTIPWPYLTDRMEINKCPYKGYKPKIGWFDVSLSLFSSWQRCVYTSQDTQIVQNSGEITKANSRPQYLVARKVLIGCMCHFATDGTVLPGTLLSSSPSTSWMGLCGTNVYFDFLLCPNSKKCQYDHHFMAFFVGCHVRYVEKATLLTNAENNISGSGSFTVWHSTLLPSHIEFLGIYLIVMIMRIHQ